MTEQELERIVQQLRQEFLGLRLQLPAVLSKKRAAEELSISVTKLMELVRCGAVLTVKIGKTKMIPASEVRRLATPKSMK